MPYYAVELYAQTCSEGDCGKPATDEVRNPRNEPVRQCCRKHAIEAITRLNRADEIRRRSDALDAQRPDAPG